MKGHVLRSLLLLLAALAVPRTDGRQQSPLPLVSGDTVAPGVRYYRFDAKDHLGAGAHISARLLEVKPDRVQLDLELGKDGLQGRDTVPSMAARRRALAAVNAGFFGTSGDPAGIFKIDGQLISDTARPRGAVGFAEPDGAPLLFDRVTARAQVRIGRTLVPVSVDTARPARGVVLYTPRYGFDTKTSSGGTEWVIAGTPLRVTQIKQEGATVIPKTGYVLSASGDIPPALAGLDLRDRADVQFSYETALGTQSARWRRADDIVGGAGLLIWRGRDQHDWAAERLDVKGFVDARHPRTLIGRDREGDTWLIVVDGRQPAHSVGMSLAELTAFARRLGMVDALNLDGGGSSTMVVKGTVVNKPSDATGPRPVSDAIVVLNK